MLSSDVGELFEIEESYIESDFEFWDEHLDNDDAFDDESDYGYDDDDDHLETDFLQASESITVNSDRLPEVESTESLESSDDTSGTGLQVTASVDASPPPILHSRFDRAFAHEPTGLASSLSEDVPVTWRADPQPSTADGPQDSPAAGDAFRGQRELPLPDLDTHAPAMFDSATIVTEAASAVLPESSDPSDSPSVGGRWFGSLADDIVAIDEALRQFFASDALVSSTLGTRLSPSMLVTAGVAVAGVIAMESHRYRHSQQRRVSQFDARLYPEIFG